MSAESAARQIIAACKGDAEVVLSPPAQIGDKFHALPGPTSDLLSWVNRLPYPDGIGTERARRKR